MEKRKKLLPELVGDVSSYQSYYDKNSFKSKIRKIAKFAGENVLRPILHLYYMLQDGKVPLKHKAYIVGALGYFILPVDLIPDFIAALGFTDDLAVAAILLKQLKENITPEVKEKT
ncbi:MAG: DUF1232 domain-containing protein, partial [Tannerella sp.]|nr:DUF1232 domain-containing protein [Tannerella sp.]